MREPTALTEHIRFGGGPGLYVRTSLGTPYLVVGDINGAAILALAVNAEGFVIHPGHGVNVGDPLAEDAKVAM